MLRKFDSYLYYKFKQKMREESYPQNSSYGTFKKVEEDLRHPKTLLTNQYESLDYDPSENSLMIDAEKRSNYRDYKCIQFQRWVIMLLIGVITAIIACIIDISIDFITEIIYKFMRVSLDDMRVVATQDSIHHNITTEHKTLTILAPYFSWIGIGLACVITPAILVIFIEPMASGSGISQIKCFLNGVKIPNIVRLKTLIIKVYGMIFAISSGLIIGKEGPMVHIGSIVGAGISQGCSSTLKFDLKIFEKFRTDTEKRDFVSAGTAAGLSAAFGAPIGGLLLSLEEGASFWNQGLTWRIFFASLTSSFTLNVIMSAYHGHPGELSNTGLINFGKLNDIYYSIKEVPIFILMACAGGVLGALFNHLNIKLTLFRMRHITNRGMKLMEVFLVSLVTSAILFNIMYYSQSCVPFPSDRKIARPIRMFCGENEYNSIATLFFQTAEHRIKGLFHESPETYNPIWLLALFLTWFLLACWTFGVSVPSGLFIPCLLIGATWGRLVGILLGRYFPGASWAANPSKFALLGAAVQLGGVVRMTLSLTVMLIEATGNTTFGLVIMLCLVITKWVGDLFNEGVFEMHIHMLSIPFIDWEPPPLSYHITANEIMSHPVTTLRTVENVSRIIEILKAETHNGYPLVDTAREPHRLSFGRFRGLILRSQLLVILLHKYSKFKDLNGTGADGTKIQDKKNSSIKDLLKYVDNPEGGTLVSKRAPFVKFLSPQPLIDTANQAASNFFSFSCSPNYKWRKLDARDGERQLLIAKLEPTNTTEDSDATMLLVTSKNSPSRKIEWADNSNNLPSGSDDKIPSTSNSPQIICVAPAPPPTTKPHKTGGQNSLLRNVLDKNRRLKLNDLSKPAIIELPQDDLLREIESSGDPIDLSNLLSLKNFTEPYPRFFNIDDIEFEEGIEFGNELVDLQPYCCKAPYTISSSATLPRVFKLFRALGLRHLTVINEKNEVVGMITRKDVARFRWFESAIHGSVKELNIYQG